MSFYKTEECLSLAPHLFLQSHTRWSCCMTLGQALKTSMKPALKLLSITLHEPLLWLCQKSCKQHLLLSVDTSQHPHRALLSSAGISGLCSIWHHTEKVMLLPVTQTHIHTTTACLTVSSLISWLITCNVFYWQHILLCPIQPPRKTQNKSYGSMQRWRHS